jgi:hypothetical protein
MITIGYSTRQHNPELISYFKKSSGNPKNQVIEKVNNGEKNLSQVYNEIINESENDIIVLCHDDIYFDTKNWSSKLVRLFDKNPEYGILGMAGTTHMPISGMWWEDRTKMYGIVNHESEGKKWESKYSNIFENSIKPVVIVDGVFIAINKKRIKELFDESVEGFHLYDVNFCFKNFLLNVNIGVLTNIRITHKSIGMTNEQWEVNKNIFKEKYKPNLPAKIKFKDTDKLNVMISCVSFQDYTGSEMYAFELSKNLIKQNCNVTVVASRTNGPLVSLANKLGVIVKNINEPPGYKLGDGKWIINTPEGPKVTIPNNFYKLNDVHYDIIHCQHKPIVDIMNTLYPTIDKISTIHSEVIDMEFPVINDSIKKYIAIRPEIKEHLINNFNIPETDIEVIYNPIDDEKFKPKNKPSENSVLFVGTIDYLRKNSIFDLVKYTKQENKELWLVGKNQSNYLPEIIKHPHVKYFDATPNVDSFIHRCSETAGILLGRTTIEGWMCGKSGWIYNVDSSGNIIDKKFHEVPNDLEKFNSTNVVKKIKDLYLKTLNN